MGVTVSCCGKLHAFALAEQFSKHNQLDQFCTTYASNKNTILSHFVKRVDKEIIPVDKIRTNILLAFPIKLYQKKVHLWNDLFDKWVANKLKSSKSQVFVGWSGMSLNAMRTAKVKGMINILERGSSHILYQDEILKGEHKRFGIDFRIHPVVVEKELKEYEEADYISVPSHFVKNSFLDKGVSSSKLIVNPYGSGEHFATTFKEKNASGKFVIVYLGTLSIRKGLIYFFDALRLLHLSEKEFEVWYIGAVEPNLQETVDKFKRDNWIFFGQINHYDLHRHLSKCDVGVQPSLEEGLSMVIPQMMACGIPMIVTANSGGEDIIKNGENGFVVPIRQPAAIAERIMEVYSDRKKLSAMSTAARESIQVGFKWDDYGERYSKFINTLL